MYSTDEKYLEDCLILAKKAMHKGNPPVGAILVREGEIVGEGEEAGKSTRDITYHAEIEAIRNARENLQTADLSDCILYTTHEPCWMCSYVIRHHRIGKIVIGSETGYTGGASSEFPILLTENVPNWEKAPEIIWGVLKKQCEDLMEEYRRMINL